MNDTFGRPLLTATDNSNPWWALLEGAVAKANGKLRKPEIFPASTDARYFRLLGLPAISFSPMANTPILLHDHNEVCSFFAFLYFPFYPLLWNLTWGSFIACTLAYRMPYLFAVITKYMVISLWLKLGNCQSTDCLC